MSRRSKRKKKAILQRPATVGNLALAPAEATPAPETVEAVLPPAESPWPVRSERAGEIVAAAVAPAVVVAAGPAIVVTAPAEGHFSSEELDFFQRADELYQTPPADSFDDLD